MRYLQPLNDMICVMRDFTSDFSKYRVVEGSTSLGDLGDNFNEAEN